MNGMLSCLRWSWKLSGFDFRTLSRNVRSLPFYISTMRELRRQARHSSEPFPFGPVRPILAERYAQAGSASGHYFHQDLYVARKLFQNNPVRHIDVGSRVDGFIAHVASFRAIEVIDVRPLTSNIPNVSFLCADMMNELPEDLRACTDSLSCLHAIEHFGLGRYGDPIRFDGHLAGMDNLYQMLKPGGKFYLSTPIGEKQRIEFNAHRVFSLPYLLERLQDRYEIDSFACVDDSGALRTEVDPFSSDAPRTFGFRYGCGIFELTRKPG